MILITQPQRRRALLAGVMVCLCGMAASTAPAATVAGNVVLINSKDRAVNKERDYSGVVVWLEPWNGAPQPPAGRPLRATMLQKNKTFIPHVLAVEVGTAVDFPNSDPLFHNVFSNYDGQVFDLHLYAPQSSRRVVFRRPGMVRVFCNIHATMSAVIAVLPTPYFTVTGPGGHFEIQAPPGAYRLLVWQERAQAPVLAALERRITVDGGNLALPEIRISKEGYLALPHKNKYGRDYPPAPEDRIFYPGGRR